MKKVLLTLFAISTVVAILAHDDVVPCGRCNDPAAGRKTCGSGSTCHSSPQSHPWSSITSTVPGTGYVPGTTYTVTATITRANHTKFGFEISDQTLAGVTGGTLINTTPTTVQIKDSLNNHYVMQTLAGCTGTTGFHTWQFNWVAPAGGTGTVRFYGAFNVTNNNNMRSGDTISLDSMTVSENIAMGLSGFGYYGKAFKMFPNPASDNVSVEYAVEQPSHVEVALIDSRTAIVSVLLSEEKFTGDFHHDFSLKGNYTPGIYFLKTTIGDKASLQKLIIL
jgi:hypothetical protein